MRIICQLNWCYKLLEQRSDESNIHRWDRQYCSQSHANASSQGAKNRARVKVTKPETHYINGWALI